MLFRCNFNYLTNRCLKPESNDEANIAENKSCLPDPSSLSVSLFFPALR